MIKVKICGITNLEDALLASKFGADALGFIFSKKSPRYINKEAARKITDKLDPFLLKVGVFLDETKEAVSDIAGYVKLDVLQFHGSESASYCQNFKPKFKIIKVFFPQNRPYQLKVSRYHVDAFMFDLPYAEKTAGVKSLTTQALKEIKQLIAGGSRVIISGGLNINNVDKTKQLSPYAVDVASGVEKFVGKKDERLLETFIRKMKQ